MKRILCMFCLLFFFSSFAFGGTWKGLNPGVSKKADADRVLGSPIKEVIRGERYDYNPTSQDTSRISIKFNKNTQIIESIDIYMKIQYDRSRYKEWFELGEPAKKEMDANGNLVEYYLPQKVSLHYAGVKDSNPVEFFSHFAPSTLEREKMAKPSPPTTPPPPQQVPKTVSPPSQQIPKSLSPPSQQARVQNRQYYETGAKQALDNKDFQKLRRILDEGLLYYPDSAALWSYEGGYYFLYNESGEFSFRREKALRALKKAVQIEPSGRCYVNLGLVYANMFKDYSSALDCYGKAGDYVLSYPRTYYFMAICYEELNYLHLAVSHYEKFLQAAPNDQNAQDARNRLSRLR